MTRCESAPQDERPRGLAALEAWGLARCPEAALRRLEPAVERLSKGFTDARPEAFAAYLEEPDALTAYTLFFAPQTYARAAEALRGILARLPATPAARPARVLDLGCGVGSAALAAVSDVMARMGADSRAARLCCVISGASETVFFTASLYLGAAGVKRSRYAVPAALAAYAAGVWAAAWLV